MTIKGWTPAFYSADNPVELRWRIEPHLVSIWMETDGVSSDEIAVDRIAAYKLANAIMQGGKP